MLVLSRKTGQSVMIDDQFVVTVVRCSVDAVTLSLTNERGVPVEKMVVRRDQLHRLMGDVEVVLIEVDAEKARLGFQCSDNSEMATRIARNEWWGEPNR